MSPKEPTTLVIKINTKFNVQNFTLEVLNDAKQKYNINFESTFISVHVHS